MSAACAPAVSESSAAAVRRRIFMMGSSSGFWPNYEGVTECCLQPCVQKLRYLDIGFLVVNFLGTALFRAQTKTPAARPGFSILADVAEISTSQQPGC